MEERFDPESGKKRKKTLVPVEQFLKVDWFASQEPHPFCHSFSSFQIIPDDSSVTLLRKDFLTQRSGRVSQWMSRCLLFLCGLCLTILSVAYFWVNFGSSVWKYFFDSNL